MQITVKTTQNKIHKVDVEPSDSIGTLKSKIEAVHGYPAITQKVIYSGKILADDKTIESCGVKEKDFFVLMVSKPKPTPTPKHEIPSTSNVPIPATAPTPAAPPATAPSATAESPAQTPSTATATTQTSAQVGPGDSAFLTGEALQNTINNMVEMGFPRDQVLRALRASFNNPDRAVEYLMNGIPAHLDAESAPPAPAPPAQPNPPSAAPIQSNPTSAPPAAPAPAAPQSNQPQNLFQLAQQQQRAGAGAGAGLGAGLGAGAGAGAGAGGQLDLGAALGNNPQMAGLREAVAQNPALIQPLIQQLAHQNPALAQHLANNPDLLLQILGGLGGGEGADDGEGGPGHQVISVTEEERAAIGRLEALGFTRQQAIEAYLACDKNEELAANYLFENAFDD